MPWPRCGRPPTLIYVVFDPDFYGNADRLEGQSSATQQGE
jgi:hypothetical protein